MSVPSDLPPTDAAQSSQAKNARCDVRIDAPHTQPFVGERSGTLRGERVQESQSADVLQTSDAPPRGLRGSDKPGTVPGQPSDLSGARLKGNVSDLPVALNGDEPLLLSGSDCRVEEMMPRQLRTQVMQLTDHLASRQQELDRREAELEARATELEARLRAARLWFNERESEIDQRRERWLEERRDAQEQLTAARRQLDEQRRCDWADLEEKRRAVGRRSEEVDRAWLALRELHQETSRICRATMELRIVHEESQAESIPIAEKERQDCSASRLRARLTEEYRRASQALAQQKQELLALRRDLTEQYNRLLGERAGLVKFETQGRRAASA